jgi:lipopolysaccharide exporter
MTSVRRALFLSMAQSYALIAISLVSNILLARLLTPEEIGIYSVSLAVVGIAQVLREFGIGNYLIQVKNITEAHIRTAFGISLVIGSTLFIVVNFAAPLASSFYNEPRLLDTMRISAISFLTLPFCTISVAILKREMLFQRMVTVTLIATSVGFITTISFAYSGFGQNSMAIGAVITNIVIGLGAWVARTDRKLFLPGFSEWRTLLKFGAQSSIASVVTSIAMDINDLVLGKILGFAPVAIMSRAQGLMYLFHRDIMSAIRNVAYPFFAKAHREGDSLEGRYITSVTAVTVIAWPFYGFSSLFALEIVRLMFGTQWDEAVILVPFFCLAGAFAATSNLIINAIMAVGRNDLVMKSELLFQPVRVALIVAAAMIFQSLLACTIAYLIAFVLHTPLMYIFKGRCIPNNFQSLLPNLLLSAKVTLMALAIPVALAIHAGLDRNSPASFGTLIAASALCAVSWLSALIMFKHPITTDPLFKRFISKIYFLK